MSKLTDYSAITELAADNIFIVDGANGTKKILTTDAILSAFHLVSPEMHRMIFRGKNLGSSFTTVQKASIAAGSFKDLWLGDYWEISGVKYRIADFDYWLHEGDTELTSHHAVVMPDSDLFNSRMNPTSSTAGAYGDSEMRASTLNTAKATIVSGFGNSLLTHRDYFVNAVSNGKSSGGAWYDSMVELPSEIMMYGHYHFSPNGSDGTTISVNYTIDKTQLALFSVAPKYITNRQHYWLRDVVSSAEFALVSAEGYASYYYSASNPEIGVRPVFGLVGA